MAARLQALFTEFNRRRGLVPRHVEYNVKQMWTISFIFFELLLI